MSQDTPMKPALAKCEEAVQPPGPTGFGIGDGDICAECGSMVDTDGRDWEDGDLCWTCKAERFDTLVENVPILAAEHRAALAKLEAARKTLLNIARYTGAGPYTKDRFDAVKSSAMGTFEETKPDASPLRTGITCDHDAGKCDLSFEPESIRPPKTDPWECPHCKDSTRDHNCEDFRPTRTST